MRPVYNTIKRGGKKRDGRSCKEQTNTREYEKAGTHANGNRVWLPILSHYDVLRCSLEGLSQLLRKDKQRPCHGSGIRYRFLTTRTAFAPRAIDVEFVVGKVAREVSLLSVLHLPLSIQIPH